MNVLGVSCFYHDAAACLIVDGELVAASEEERFTRKKYDPSFPENAIRFCLEQAGITEKDIDYVVFYEKPFVKFERIIRNTIEYFPWTYKQFVQAIPVWLKEKLWFPHVFKTKFDLDKKAEFLFVDHHLSHAASSYFCSPFRKSAILTADGVGENATSALGMAENNVIKIEKFLDYPHSLGLLYSTFTAFLGFMVNNGEYKVMGLAAYGKPAYLDEVNALVDIKEDGSFHLDMKYFAFQHGQVSYSKKFLELFGEPRKAGAEMTDHYRDIAASAQRLVEEILLLQARWLYEQTETPNLCMAGGVALNCVANGRILRETGFENLYIQPSAGDAGGAIGAALYAYYQLLSHENGEKKTHKVLDKAYLGSDGLEKESVEEFLKRRNIRFEKLDDEQLLEKVSGDVAESKVVGWFQGRSEFGPRALGNRSILANPLDRKMKDIINAKIKKRELFRPFAPSCLEEKADEYFDLKGKKSPFMLLVEKVKDEFQARLPAITHVDGSARIQTVNREQNAKYYDLIKRIGDKTGVYVVVNTSFNVRGEPIVRTPEEAYNCFMDTEMDVLVMGNYYLTK